MMSVSKMGRGAENYYLKISREDYYTEGSEPPGYWAGKGAQSFGLTGEVSTAQLKALVAGFHPDSGEQLVQSAGRDNHQSGWDVTFSAPKSVSVLWGIGDDRTRQALSDSHKAAVQAALTYLEENALLTRRGHAGRTVERAASVVAVFEHGTSREQDPHLHSHALFLNVCVRGDGSARSLQSRPLYEHKMAAGALYQAELAMGITRALGLAIEREGISFRLSVIPRKVCAAFSKRRAQIEKHMVAGGWSGPEAAERSALVTRTRKRTVPREQLREGWRDAARELGFEPLIGAHEPSRAEPLRVEVVRARIERSLENDSTFRETDLIRELAKDAIGNGQGAAQVRSAVAAELGSGRYKELATERHRTFASREMLALEKQVLGRAIESRSEKGLGCSPRVVENAISRHGFFRQEKADALRYLLSDGGSIRVLDGLSGTGKTSLLEAAREGWEEQGFRVVGAATTGAGSRRLKETSGIESGTVRQLLDGLRQTVLDSAIHHGRQILREATGRKGYRQKLPRLDDRTILVIDDAKSVGTQQMAELMERAKLAGSTLALVGDRFSLPPFEGVSPFTAVLKAIGGATLEVISRQREEWGREATKSFADGDVRSALDEYRKRGFLLSGADELETRKRLVGDFLAVPEGETALALAKTKSQVAELNRSIQEERRARGELGPTWATGEGGEAVRTGDRIHLERGSRILGVEAGSFGTVLDIGLSLRRNDIEVQVEVDGQGLVTLPIKRYKGFSLGYAATAHTAAGITVDQAFVMLDGGPALFREDLYVLASKGRKETCFYETDLEPRDRDQRLTIMERSRSLTISPEVARPVEIEGPDR